MFEMLRRSLSTLTASALVLGLIAFVPNTMAANDLSFSPTPEAEYVTGGDPYEVKVALSNYTQSTKVDLVVAKKGTFDVNVVDSYTYLENKLNIFKWDGKINGVEASAGTYIASLRVGDTFPISHEFTVINGPKLAFSPEPAAEYQIGSGDYKASVALTNYIADTDVKFSVYKKGDNLQPLIDTKNFDNNETLEFTWNGQGATAGTYVLKFTGTDKDGNPTNVLTKEFQIKDESQPTLAFSPKPSNEYTLGGATYKVSVALTNYKADTLVKLGVREKGANTYFVVDNYDYQTNETRQFSWDGKINGNLVDAGTYELLLSGTDDNNNSTNQLPHELVVKEEVDNTLCAGYKDVNANNKYCDALEWLQDENIMTGEGNGEFFNGNGALNRAAVSRIALEAHNEYSQNTDYCNDNKPFPDVALGEWYSNYICRAKVIKMVTGYEAGVDAGKFVPGRSVSVIEMFAILLRPLNENFVAGSSYQGLASNQWYSEYAKYAKDHSLYPGTTLSPTQEATRYEVAQFLYELHLDGKL